MALVVIVAGIAVVRAGWGSRHRKVAVSGWLIVTVALAVLVAANGAWGLAMGTVAATVAALILVLWAGWTAPAKRARPRREPPSITLPRRWGDTARRIAVFVLTVPSAFAAAQWLAFGIQAVARGAGAVPADANVTMLLLQPILWTALLSAQMTCPRPSRMLAPPAAAALLGTVCWAVA